MRRAKGYQDLDDSAVGPRPPAPAMPPPQEIEMASVSVVPDGKIYLLAFYISHSLFAYRILITTLVKIVMFTCLGTY